MNMFKGMFNNHPEQYIHQLPNVKQGYTREDLCK